MPKQHVPSAVANNPSLDSYRKCEKCEAGLADLKVGGDGDWRTTIMCCVCFHVRRGVPFERVIVPLNAEKYSLSHDETRRRINRSQAEYEAVVLEEASYGSAQDAS